MRENKIVLTKAAVFLLSLLPFILFWWQAFNHTLGPNPVETALHTSGDWAIRFLLLTLALPFIKRAA
ncbi:MAG: sulfoxide reductase heme-binding subunit YedZ, partial [Gammaproteobacteria bacterium]|nr:sulfoxide reductase heme-binding subunit YedZ [Gammaproteobacteria bacterium]